VALVSGYFLIPAYGLMGAALSMLSYNFVSMTWNNFYLAKLGLWPYSLRLVPQIAWIFILFGLYIFVNVSGVEFVIWQKLIMYVISLAGLGIYWILQKKRIEYKK